jgi:hypothetical protein
MVCKNGTIFVGESNCSAVHPEALDQIRAQMRVLVSVACGIHVIHSSQLAHWLAPLLIARWFTGDSDTTTSYLDSYHPVQPDGIGVCFIAHDWDGHIRTNKKSSGTQAEMSFFRLG